MPNCPRLVVATADKLRMRAITAPADARARRGALVRIIEAFVERKRAALLVLVFAKLSESVFGPAPCLMKDHLDSQLDGATHPMHRVAYKVENPPDIGLLQRILWKYHRLAELRSLSSICRKLLFALLA